MYTRLTIRQEDLPWLPHSCHKLVEDLRLKIRITPKFDYLSRERVLYFSTLFSGARARARRRPQPTDPADHRHGEDARRAPTPVKRPHISQASNEQALEALGILELLKQARN